VKIIWYTLIYRRRNEKIADISIGITLSVFLFLAWCFKMTIAGDIPVVISMENFN